MTRFDEPRETPMNPVVLVCGLWLACSGQATDLGSIDIHPDGYPTVEAVK